MFTKLDKPFKPVNPEYPTTKSRWIDSDTGLRKNFDGTLEKPKFMKMTHRGALTKPKKKVVAKMMYEAGWGTKHLSQWFKIEPATVYNWAKIPTPESLKEFEQNFKMAMTDYDMESTVRIKSRIMQVVPNETDINKLVKAGEYFDGQREKRVSQNNTQVNVYADMIKKYSEESKQ